jgi:hypothetical protein
MNKVLSLLSLTVFLFISACGTEKKHADHDHSTHQATPTNKGFDGLPELAASVIQSIANYDYDEYYTHIMTKEQERSAASLIQNEVNRTSFLKEFEFSIKEEKDYFMNLEKLIKEESLDLANARVSEMEIIDYKPSEYAPLVLKEVIVPVMKGEFETDITFVAIQMDGKWYLTAELGI